MSGNSKGGKLAAATNVKRHGSDFYARIGAMGGKKGKTGGFFANRDLAREAGRKGGRISRRTKKADDTSVVVSITSVRPVSDDDDDQQAQQIAA